MFTVDVQVQSRMPRGRRCSLHYVGHDADVGADNADGAVEGSMTQKGKKKEKEVHIERAD